MYYCNRVILYVYINNIYIFTKDLRKTKKILQELRDLGFDLDSENTIAQYIGINIEKTKTGKYILSQSVFINKIFTILNLTEEKTKIYNTPADKILRSGKIYSCVEI